MSFKKVTIVDYNVTKINALHFNLKNNKNRMKSNPSKQIFCFFFPPYFFLYASLKELMKKLAFLNDLFRSKAAFFKGRFSINLYFIGCIVRIFLRD